jgi:hypothetical protein
MKYAEKITVFSISLFLCLTLLFSSVFPVYGLEVTDESGSFEVLAEDGTTETASQVGESTNVTQVDHAADLPEAESATETDEQPSASVPAESESTAWDDAQAESETLELAVAEKLTLETLETSAETSTASPDVSEGPVRAMAAPPNPERDFVFDRSTGTITDYVGYRKDIVIPSTIGGVAVTAIGSSAFRNRQLTGVRIPNSITVIGPYAFEENQLTSINIPSSVTRINRGAFADNQLTGISIPDSVTYLSGFCGNQLRNIEIPDSVKYIGREAFCSNQLTTVTIPDSVKFIDIEAFGNNQLTGITIPDSVTGIGYGAFAKNKLTKIVIPDSVKELQRGAFQDNQLTSVSIPNSLDTIPLWAFRGNQLTSVTIPDSVTFIGEHAFADNRLTGVTIPNSVTTIRAGAFTENLLTTVTVPNSVTDLAYDAFDPNVRIIRSSAYGMAVARAGFQNPVEVGMPVTLAQRAVGGAGGSKYKFSVKRSNGSIVSFGGYRTQNNYTWRPVTPDTYTVIFEAMDAAGNTAKTTRTLRVIPSSYYIAVARAGFQNPVNVGTAIVLAQRAEGGTGVSKYRFSVKRSNGSIVSFGGYRSLNNYTWTPVTPDTYTVIFEAKDALGRTAKTTRTLRVIPSPYHIAVARAGFKNPVDARTPVILAQRAEGGSGASKYRFSVIRSNGSKVPFGTYSGRNIYTWTPITSDIYTVVFEAKDAVGRTAKTTRTLTVR